MKAAPSNPLPNFPADIRLTRTRIKLARDKSPSKTKGSAAPMPNTAIVSVTRSRSWPWEASSDAAPSVGPTQGDHTAPSRRPIANWPASPEEAKRLPKWRSAQLETGPPAAASRACHDGSSSTTPSATMIAAAARRNMPASMSRENPTSASNRPSPVNDSARPAAKASAPSGWAVTAAPSTIGTSGNTHGDRIDSNPAAKANAKPVTEALKALVEQRGDRGFLGVADRTTLFSSSLEDDQRRLHLSAELLDHRLHGVEIHAKDFHIPEFRIRGQLVENGALRLAGGAPIGMDFNQDRATRCLRRLEGIRRKRNGGAGPRGGELYGSHQCSRHNRPVENPAR